MFVIQIVLQSSKLKVVLSKLKIDKKS